MIEWLNQNVYQNPRSLIPSLGLITTGSLALLSGIPLLTAGIIALSASGVSYLFVRAVQRVNGLLDTLEGTLEAAKKAAEDVDELKKEIVKDGKIDKLNTIEKNIVEATALLKIALKEVVEKNPDTKQNKIDQISQVVKKFDSLVEKFEKNKNIEKFTEMENNLIDITSNIKGLMLEIREKNPTTQKTKVEEVGDILHKLNMTVEQIKNITHNITDVNPETQKSNMDDLGDILHKISFITDKIKKITSDITDKNTETEKSKVDELVGTIDKLNGILDAIRADAKIEKIGLIEKSAFETLTNVNGAIDDFRTGGVTFLMRGNGRSAPATNNASTGQNDDANNNTKSWFGWGN
ncbi:MAG TPA: hypothetical protein VFP93_04500 [Gammaproteobacteria bacterium]|nr:hypothetical protein [Gammaproteobacteria bacterium]